MSKPDSRPICTCSVYKFPHRIGGKCSGSTFAEFYFYNNRSLCNECNCNNDNECDVVTGRESINEAECYEEAKHSYPGERLIMSFTQI